MLLQQRSHWWSGWVLFNARGKTTLGAFWVLLLTMSAALAIALATCRCSRRFDAALWQATGWEAFASGRISVSDAPRELMINDLLRRHRLLNMSRAEVQALLGPPDFSRCVPFEDWDLIYWLGPDHRAAPLDFKWLLIRVDRHGKVSEWKLTFD
jgi:hypothetical protein